jgi:membrane protease subunit HflK
LYLDAVQEIMTNTSKILVDQKGGNNLLYLPLDKIIQMSGAAAPPPVDAMSRPADASPGSEVTPPAPAVSRSRDGLRSREREPR